MMKNVIISGAKGNLGAFVVKKFLSSGYRVIATTHAAETLGYEEENPNLDVHPVDANEIMIVNYFVENIAKKYGTIDGYIHLIGGFTAGTLDETVMDDLHRMLSLNFETAFNFVHPVLKFMKQQKSGGRMILMGSGPGLDAAAARTSVAYGISKSLLFRLAEIINLEGKKKSVSCSVFVPGTIDTPANRESMPDADTSKWTRPEAIADRMEKIVSGQEAPLIVRFDQAVTT